MSHCGVNGKSWQPHSSTKSLPHGTRNGFRWRRKRSAVTVGIVEQNREYDQCLVWNRLFSSGVILVLPASFNLLNQLIELIGKVLPWRWKEWRAVLHWLKESDSSCWHWKLTHEAGLDSYKPSVSARDNKGNEHITFRIFTGCKGLMRLFCTKRPVAVLTGTVNAAERLFAETIR